uniref:SH3 domain protein n=1 Tax=Candidatus Kentrum sp. FW TaxID=2126338 RepID=A0A450SY53_9GAMM|nr:MAG: SH3 domain protein [Candidatus Kentron sp. FW]
MVMKNLPGYPSIPFATYVKRWIIIGLLACLPGIACAETAYVIDRLLAGIHEDKTQDSTVLEVLPTGSALEVISREEDFTRVRTTNGIVGWIDTNYLMSEKPAQLLLMELEAVQEQTETELKEAKAQLGKLTEKASDNDFDFISEIEARIGFEIPLPSTAHQKWVLLILGFVLSFALGGYLTDRTICRRYYLVERGRKRPLSKIRDNKNPKTENKGKEDKTTQQPMGTEPKESRD